MAARPVGGLEVVIGSAKRRLDGERLERITLVQIGRLGDLVASRTAIHSLAARYPETQLELVVREPYVELFVREPGVTRILAYPSGRGTRAALGLVHQVRSSRPSLLIDLTGSTRSRWLAGLGGAARRAGWGRRWLYAYGTNEVRRRDANYTLEIARLLESLGVPPLLDLPPLAAPPPPERLRELLHRPGAAKPIVLHPGAANPIRHWRGDRFARLAERLTERGWAPLLVAGPAERAEAERLAKAARVPLPVFAAGSVLELAAALVSARLFVGLDSGPMHLAAALGVPTIALFGPNVPRRAAPARGRVSVLEVELPCRPCSQVLAECVLPEYNCMDRIEVEAVVARAAAVLHS